MLRPFFLDPEGEVSIWISIIVWLLGTGSFWLLIWRALGDLGRENPGILASELTSVAIVCIQFSFLLKGLDYWAHNLRAVSFGTFLVCGITLLLGEFDVISYEYMMKSLLEGLSDPH